jgi:ribosome modulation factor
MSKERLRAALARLCHEQWSGWMSYLFSQCKKGRNGKLIIPAWAVERWKRQMEEPYDELPENEQDSDNAEADRFLALIQEYVDCGELDLTMGEETEYYEEGYEAYTAGTSIDDCPYSRGTVGEAEWQMGWWEGQDELSDDGVGELSARLAFETVSVGPDFVHIFYAS